MPVDIGVWMSAEVLEHKLEAREEQNTEQTWNLNRWPKGFTQEGEHHLYIASRGNWCGYFILSGEALFSPDDPSAPFTLLFDTQSWTSIPPTPAKRFRSFTYNVPGVNLAPRSSVSE